MALKGSIPRRGRASIIQPDNAKTFIETLKWSGKINKNEKMQKYLIKEQNKMVI